MEEIATEAVKQTFDINPENVYGVLAALLLIACIYMAWRLYHKDKQLYELNITTIETLKDIKAALMLLQNKTYEKEN